MKILHLTDCYVPWVTGGSEVYCHRLCQQLQGLGVEVLVTFHQHPALAEPIGAHLHEGVPVQVLPPILTQTPRMSAYSRTIAEATGFAQLLADYQPEIVHLHSFSAKAGLTHIQFAKAAGCQVVLTYHTPGISCPQRSLLYRGTIVCDGELRLQRCSECRLMSAGLHPVLANLVAKWSLLDWVDQPPEASSKLWRVLTARRMTASFQQSWLTLLELVDALHVHAEWVEHLVKLNGAVANKVHFFRTGGPDAVSPSPQVRQRDDVLRVVFVGRCSPVKGIHVLVEAVNKLPANSPIAVTFLGPYWEDDAYGQGLQQRIAHDSRFEVKPTVPNGEIVTLLAGYDLCVVPSLWLETGPLVVLESFAAGVPVVGSRLGGIAELVRDGVDGMLFEPGNAIELAEILHGLSSDRDWLHSLQSNVQSPRTMADLARDTRSLYQSLLCKT